MDKAFINPTYKGGTIIATPSKSYSHRYLIAAFIANTKVKIKNINLCEDVKVTLKILKALGANYVIKGNDITFTKKEEKKINYLKVNVHQSGSSLRMLMPLISAIVPHVKYIGGPSLFTRPNEEIEDVFKKQNISINQSKEYLEVRGIFKSEDIVISSNKSSQGISGFLFANAYLKSNKNIILEKVVSPDYITMTLKVLNDFGYIFANERQRYYLDKIITINKSFFKVEGDYSSAANFIILGALKGNLTIKNLNANSLQADYKIVPLLKSIGARIKINKSSIQFSKSALSPFVYDIDNSIDLGPAIFVLASLINGTSTIKGIERLKYKESNRLECMLGVLKEMEIKYSLNDNELQITGVPSLNKKLKFEGYKDHRIIMATAISSLFNNKETIINGSEYVKKSYPHFFKDLKGLIK